MEGISLDLVMGAGSLAAGILVLALLAAFVAYGWWSDELSHRKAEGPALKKAA